MLYRAVHDIFFYLAIGFCLCLSLLVMNYSGARIKNHVVSRYDENVIVDYEKEDVLNVAKHYYGADTYFHNVPGKELLYRDSLNNIQIMDMINMCFFFIVMIINVLYGVLFFGEMYSKGAIRNMITAGAGKRKVFLSSLAVNAVFLLIFKLISILAMAVFTLVNGLYPIIYLPSFAMLLLAEFFVGMVVSSFAILVVFTIQRPFKSLLAIIVCVVLFFTLNSSFIQGQAFEMKYELNKTSYFAFISECKEKDMGFEWYFPVDGFNLYTVRKADGTLYSDFMTDRPNREYPGDAKVALSRFLWRTSVGNIYMELMVFGQYPLYRDGVLYRYMAVSSVYLCVIIAAGCAVVKRRNII